MVGAGVRHHEHTTRSPCRFNIDWKGTRKPLCSRRWASGVEALAALTAAILIGFELTLTHWFYLYIPWFFPFVAFVVLAPRRQRQAAPPSDTEPRELVAAG